MSALLTAIELRGGASPPLKETEKTRALLSLQFLQSHTPFLFLSPSLLSLFLAFSLSITRFLKRSCPSASLLLSPTHSPGRPASFLRPPLSPYPPFSFTHVSPSNARAAIPSCLLCCCRCLSGGARVAAMPTALHCAVRGALLGRMTSLSHAASPPSTPDAHSTHTHATAHAAVQPCRVAALRRSAFVLSAAWTPRASLCSAVCPLLL